MTEADSATDPALSTALLHETGRRIARTLVRFPGPAAGTP